MTHNNEVLERFVALNKLISVLDDQNDYDEIEASTYLDVIGPKLEDIEYGFISNEDEQILIDDAGKAIPELMEFISSLIRIATCFDGEHAELEKELTIESNDHEKVLCGYRAREREFKLKIEELKKEIETLKKG